MKLEHLEKTVVEMADQINKLECKIKQMDDIKLIEAVKIPEYDKTLNKNYDSKNLEDEKTLNKNDDSKNPQVKKTNFKEKNVSVFKFGAEARKTVSDKINLQEEKGSKCVKCELCDYRCERLATLKKHMNSNHNKQKCKECGQEFGTSMLLISHVAIEHNEEDDALNEVLHSTPKSDKDIKESNLKFSECMLNEFL